MFSTGSSASCSSDSMMIVLSGPPYAPLITRWNVGQWVDRSRRARQFVEAVDSRLWGQDCDMAEQAIAASVPRAFPFVPQFAALVSEDVAKFEHAWDASGFDVDA